MLVEGGESEGGAWWWGGGFQWFPSENGGMRERMHWSKFYVCIGYFYCYWLLVPGY